MPKHTRVFIVFLAAVLATGFGAVYAASTPNFHSLDLESDLKQFLTVPDAPTALHDITGDMTVEAWVKIESTPGQYVIASKWDNDGNERSWFFRYLTVRDNELKLQFANSDDGAIYGIADVVKTLEVGTWYHVAVVFDASEGSATFYVNGAQESSPQTGINGFPLKKRLYGSMDDFLIGARFDNGAPGDFYDGQIDEVRVWNDARTKEEIAANFQSELAGNEENLVGYWNFNGNADDQTVEGNNFSNTTDPTFTTDVPFFFALDSTQGKMIEGLALPDKARPAR